MCAQIALADTTTAFYYTGSPTSWVSQGNTATLTPANGYTFLPQVLPGSTSGITISVNNFPVGNWTIEFGGPNGQSLSPGTYLNAMRPFFGSSSAPALEFSGNSRGDNQLSGSFTILDLSIVNGVTISFAADFVQYDENVLTAWNYGSLRYNSTVPLHTACPFSASPTSILIGSSGGPSSINVTAANACSWTATSSAPWLTFTSGSGTGSGTLSFSTSANTGSAQMAYISLPTQVIGVMQAGSASAPLFNDVPPTDPYFDYISLLYNDGITAGCSSSPPLYCPTTPVTRAQMSVFIVAALNRALGTTLTYTQTPYFQDVPSTSIYFPFVQRIKDLGITAGCFANPPLFCPDTSIPQGQMAVFMIVSWMLANHLSTFSYSTTPYFTDVASTDPYFKFIQKMRDLGIWNGCSATLYCENDAVTRDQMAPMILRSMLGAP